MDLLHQRQARARHRSKPRHRTRRRGGTGARGLRRRDGGADRRDAAAGRGRDRARQRRRVVAVPADASVPEAIIDAVEQATQALGGSIDILVNNAGSTPEDGIDRVDFAKWQYSIALKQFGYARFAQLVLPAMRAQKWGRIVNVIGRSGHQPRPVYLAGGAVNAGLLNFTKALAEECAKDNVLVTGVNPGPIDTPRWRSLREAAARTRGITAEQYDGRAIAGVPLGRIGTSEEVAAVVLFLCSERASFVTGEIVNVDGGGTRCI